MKSFKKYILFFGFWAILIVAVYLNGRVKDNQIEKFRKISTGTITDYGFGGSGTVILHYTFEVNDTLFYGNDGIRIQNIYYHFFQGKEFPVILSGENPKNHRILMLPQDFEMWNIPFPDSLEWVKQYSKF